MSQKKNLISVLLMFSVIQHQCPQSVNCVEAIIRAFKQVDFKTFGVPVAKVEQCRRQNSKHFTGDNQPLNASSAFNILTVKTNALQ